MKIAIIGTGISGMVVAYLLHRDHDLVVYEANDYIGGHTHTIDCRDGKKDYAVDTGFIVFNEVTYPNFCKLMAQLGVESQSSTMSFSVKCERTGLEYNPNTLGAFFAQRKNLLRPSFYRMIFEILRFRQSYDRIIEQENENTTLGEFLDREGYSKLFTDKFLLPLGSAVWSADPRQFNDFPLKYLIEFFKNHGFLAVKNPFEWRVIKDGSREYVKKLTAGFSDNIRLDTPVKSVERRSDHVVVTPAGKDPERFDQVIIATHSDQALAMLEDPSNVEKEILGAIIYQRNDTVLHSDTSILPQRKNIWAAWNSLISEEEAGRVLLTYNMNILQSLSSNIDFCVTLNATENIDTEKIIGSYIYHHPVYNLEARNAQKRHSEISGVNRTHYCGAYWGYGFHEDGVKSALAVGKYFNKGL